jgi:hypothetical protein
MLPVILPVICGVKSFNTEIKWSQVQILSARHTKVGSELRFPGCRQKLAEVLGTNLGPHRRYAVVLTVAVEA